METAYSEKNKSGTCYVADWNRNSFKTLVMQGTLRMLLFNKVTGRLVISPKARCTFLENTSFTGSKKKCPFAV